MQLANHASQYESQVQALKPLLRKVAHRITRAIKLDITLYEEVEKDKSALVQAVAIITLSSIAAGIGSLDIKSPSAVLVNMLISLTGWFFWAYLTYLIGTKLMPEVQTRSSYLEMIRVIGYASSPGLFRIFGAIPYIGWIVFIAAQVWMLLAMVVAVKQALDYEDSIRPVLVSVFGWLIQVALLVLFYSWQD